MTSPHIIQAAVVDDGGTLWTLPRPFRHHHILAQITAARTYAGKPPHVMNECQGFITSAHEFVTRRMAFNLARAAGQIRRRPSGYQTKELFSEDVW